VRWFERVVACGLEGKDTTTLALQGVEGVGVREVGRVFVAEMAEALEGADSVRMVDEDDVVGGE
jgi:lipoyl(octanoyl) transferase